ncbi:MAG: hypothetical protein SNJ77_09365 [Cytophagales bacterium]
MTFFLTIPLWVWLLSIVLAFGLAYFFYDREQVWDKKKNNILFLLRLFSLFWLFVFLFSPKSEFKTQSLEKPLWLILIDDSESVKLKTKTSVIEDFFKKIESKDNWTNGAEIEILGFGSNNKDSILKFNTKESDIAKHLKNIEERFQHKNVAGIILASDGIVNVGLSPGFQEYRNSIYTIGLGDTIPEKDVLVKQVEHNKINFKGNSFPVKVKVKQFGFDNKTTNVKLLKNGKVLESKTVNFKPGRGVVEVDFLWSESLSGTYTYVVQVDALNGEYTQLNNFQSFTLDVVESKERILILSPYPHPDIKAIQESLLKNSNYEVKLCVPGVFEFDGGIYDAVIAFHLPSDENPVANRVFENLVTKKTPVCFFVGSGTNLSQFNEFSKSVNINPRGKEFDKVQGSVKSSFTTFSFEKEKADLMTKMPPVSVPFGDFVLKQNPDVFIYQKVGSVVTEKPLWMLGSADGSKNAVVVGEGWWRSKMFERRENQNSDFFDASLLKTIQFISAKEDKRKLRIQPSQSVFSTSENVFFIVETYNMIYEKTFGQTIFLELTNQSTSQKYNFEFVSSEFNSSFEVGSLPTGEYIFSAKAELNSKLESVTGKFNIQETHLELVNLTADHEMLRNLAQNNSGFFEPSSNLDKFFERISSVQTFNRTNVKTDVKDAIFLWQFLAIALLGLCAEWMLRKWWGGY